MAHETPRDRQAARHPALDPPPSRVAGHETPRDRQAARHPLCLRGLSLDDYTRCIAEAEDDTERQRMVIRDLPRKLHAMAREQRYRVLHARPEPSGTRWDALIGGMVEHVAWLNGWENPCWNEAPEWFLAPPWFVTDSPAIRADAAMYGPGAFIRHGAIPDPLELDGRGGERFDWMARS